MTLLLTRRDVRQLLAMPECIAAVEDAFVAHAHGRTIAPGVLGTHVDGGGFHVKTAGLRASDRGDAPTFVAKVNANFPGNPSAHGLPTIQGVLALFHAENGRVLALMDSSELTSIRTAAATAVAAKHLARAGASTATICGCGEQARSQLRALACVRAIRTVLVFDVDHAAAVRFADAMAHELEVDVRPVRSLGDATRAADVWITCTTARRWFVGREHVAPGAFIAAVGADNPEKSEVEPALMASSTVVADVLEQCATIGDLHHALAAGAMRREDVHGELADVVVGRRRGRERDDEVIVFDSTGTALQDVAAASLVYERARASGIGLRTDLASA